MSFYRYGVTVTAVAAFVLQTAFVGVPARAQTDDATAGTGSVPGVTNYTASELGSPPTGYQEWVVLDADTHNLSNPAQSALQYTGTVTIQATGIISGESGLLTDPYYKVAQNSNYDIVHNSAQNLALHINGTTVHEVPNSYHADTHSYVASFDLGSDPQYVSLAIDDSVLSGNDGSFKIAVKGDAVVSTPDDSTVQPDLTVTDVTYEVEDKAVNGNTYKAINVYARYKNVGDAMITNQAVQITAEISASTEDYPSGFAAERSVQLTDFASGDEAKQFITSYLVSPGHAVDTEMIVAIDKSSNSSQNNVVDESNEDNNALTKRITYDSSDADTFRISDVEVSNITNESAVITWHTNEPASSDVHYYYPADKSEYENWDWTYADDYTRTNHSVTLQNLKSATTYYFEVRSSRKSGEALTVSEEYSFTTKEAGDSESLVELFPKNMVAGEGGVTFRYGNLGPDTVNGGFAITLRELNGKVLSNGQSILRVEVPAGEKLGSGELTSTFFDINAANAAIYKTEVRLDADNDIAEGDEENNTMRRFITVTDRHTIIISGDDEDTDGSEPGDDNGDSEEPGDDEDTDEMPTGSDNRNTVTPNHGQRAVERLTLHLQRRISQLEQKVIDLEKRLVTRVNQQLARRVAGRILLQVENNGEAWYVDPESENKLYLRDGTAAYDIMRGLGLGVSNANLEKIPVGVQENLYDLTDTDGDGLPDKLEEAIGSDPQKADSDGDGYDDKTELLSNYRPNGQTRYGIDNAFANRFKGRILLQVEGNGEAWYINPADGKRYYLGDPKTAYNAMRFLSLGINNDDLRQIEVGEFVEE